MKNNLLLIILDSCRFDTFVAASTPHIERIGEAERRYSYASWTFPSHAVYLMGVSPHRSRPGEFASEVYKRDFRGWSDRLGIADVSFRGFIPQLSLPGFLKQHGYRTSALVSLPVLNPATILNRHFDEFVLMEEHNNLEAIVNRLEFSKTQPCFYLINTGETHYPYSLPGESTDQLPILHGVHGVFKHLDDSSEAAENRLIDDIFNQDQLDALKEKQRRNVEHVDKVFAALLDKVPAQTHIIVTSDHGELFGEDGYFGHGPIFHEKVFEVFFLEGRAS